MKDLLKPENKRKLVSILACHVVAGQVMAADVAKLKEAKTVEGSKVKIEVKDGKVKVNDAKVVKTDIFVLEFRPLQSREHQVVRAPRCPLVRDHASHTDRGAHPT